MNDLPYYDDTDILYRRRALSLEPLECAVTPPPTDHVASPNYWVDPNSTAMLDSRLVRVFLSRSINASDES